MLIELMVIDVNRHKFGFAELDNYALSLDRAIFNILEKEIAARVRKRRHSAELDSLID